MGGKKSSCILLLAAFAAFLRLGSAEGDPLPPSLVDMVRESPISSIEDLKKLLDTESVEEDSDNQTTNDIHSSDGHHRVPRSLMPNAEPAQQAACKVRTEVLEVTRSMHDRTNAHFMLWPLCVEVQRCSGCCNSRTSQCVPIITEIRQLQMTKITYVNTRAHFEKVIVPVEDHVRCGCQSLTSPYSSSNAHNSAARKPQPQPQPTTPPPPPPAPRLAHKPAQPQPQPNPHPQSRSQTKEDLHRHDVLKQNQRLHLEDQDSQGRLWQNNKYSVSHTAGEPHHTPARLDYQANQPRPHTPTSPHMDTHHNPPPPPRQHQQQQQQQQQHSSLTHTETPVASEGGGEGGQAPHSDSARQQEDVRQPTFQHASGDDNSRHAQGGVQHSDHHQQQQQQQPQQQPDYKQQQQQQQQQQKEHHQYPQQHDYKLNVGDQHNRQHGQSQTQTQTQSDTHMLRDSTHQPPHGSPYRHSQSDMASGHARVQSEGSSHHSQSEGSSQYDSQSEAVTNSPKDRHDAEEERRRSQIVEELEREKQKEIQEEVRSQVHQESHRYHHQTSTQRAVTESLSTLRPENTSPRPQTTPRPQPPRRRRRKNRRRISKTTMRAMIMVMS